MGGRCPPWRMKSGVLSITLPKAEKAKPQRMTES
jgi:HSP20 family molecular chaperone IbpA